MLAILFLLGSVLLGVCGVRGLLRHLLDTGEQILWGTVAGSIAATFAVYLGAKWQGQLSTGLVVGITLGLWVMAAILWAWELRRGPWAFPSEDSERRYTGLAIVLILLAPFYWRLLSIQVFHPGAGGVYSGSAGYDLNFHAALISSFRY